MASKLQNKTLQAYADAGYTLFPLIGKIPPKGFSWPSAEFNPMPSTSDFPSGNFGVKLTEEDLVIDVDPRNFPKDRKVMDEFISALGFKVIGSSFTVRTGSGGAHVYLHKPPSFAIRGALKDFPGIEFKTKGQYVVGSDSIHPDTGNSYTIHHGSPALVVDAPEKLLDLIARKEIGHEVYTPMEYTDDKATQERFLRYINTAPIAVEGQNGDRTTFAVAAVGHDFGLHPDIALTLMAEHYNPKCEPPWAYNDLKTKVYNAYRYSTEVAGIKSVEGKFPKAPINVSPSDLRCKTSGEPFNTVYNTVTSFYIDMPDVLAFNQFSEDLIFMKPAPWHDGMVEQYWSDKDSARASYYFGKERRFEPSDRNLEKALVEVGSQQSFHPIKHELENLVWDGTPRIKDWMVKFLGAKDDAYTRHVGLKVLVAAITRVYEPGCKFDYIMVLEGKQGIGKSQVVRILGGDYYGDIDINLHSKDTYDAMRRFWIIETSEMEALRKHESSAMRAFLSRQVDTYRVPYGKRAKDFKRQSIFIGTVNPERCTDIGWLKDTTGNRRYWPIELPDAPINLANLRKVRNQLWAEAFVHFKKGTPIWLDDTKIEAAAVIEQNKRMGADAWYERIVEWVTTGFAKDKKVISSSQLYCDCLGGKFAQVSTTDYRRMADIMRSLGWEKGVFWSAEVKHEVRGYRRPVPTTAEDLGI